MRNVMHYNYTILRQAELHDPPEVTGFVFISLFFLWLKSASYSLVPSDTRPLLITVLKVPCPALLTNEQIEPENVRDFRPES